MTAPAARLFGAPAPACRAAIEARIESLIALLDAIDGDPDLEAEDCRGECPDDVGEVEGATWTEAA